MKRLYPFHFFITNHPHPSHPFIGRTFNRARADNSCFGTLSAPHSCRFIPQATFRRHHSTVGQRTKTIRRLAPFNSNMRLFILLPNKFVRTINKRMNFYNVNFVFIPFCQSSRRSMFAGKGDYGFLTVSQSYCVPARSSKVHFAVLLPMARLLLCHPSILYSGMRLRR